MSADLPPQAFAAAPVEGPRVATTERVVRSHLSADRRAGLRAGAPLDLADIAVGLARGALRWLARR
ncbi:MAG: hypothetical protein H6704_05345 [Myxococcales bacterium]|nr:hypothetical protein [Myxococcales bacterium]MCB9535673.1 hypothetical protein [Myxococcales bacterium]